MLLTSLKGAIMKRHTIVAWAVLLSVPLAVSAADRTPQSMLIKVLSDEMDYSLANLAMPDGTKPYFMAYTITDEQSVSLGAELGALTGDDVEHERLLDVDVRVGDYKLDNTHNIRGGYFGFDPSDFLTAQCLLTDTSDTTVADNDTPAAGAVRHYLVRAQNDCPDSAAVLGYDGAGIERIGATCP